MRHHLPLISQEDFSRLARDLLDRCTDAVFFLLPDARIAYVNDAACRLLGWSREELLSMTLSQIDPACSAAKWAQQWEQIRQQPLTVEAVYCTRDGQPIPVELTASYLKYDDHACICLITRVLLERRRFENALSESEERFRATFEQAAVGIAHVGLNGRFLLVNQKLCEILGYAHAELLAHTFQELTWPEDLEYNLRQIRRILAGEVQTYSMEKRYLRKDGSLVWANLTVALVRDGAGQPKYFVSIVQDISQRKQAEAELKRNQEMMAGAEALAHAGSFEWDIATNRVTWSDEMYRIYGRQPEQFKPTLENFLACLHPDDQPAIEQLVQAALAGRKPFEMEERIVRPDGTHRTLVTRGAVHFDQQGQPVRLVGLCQDITERKQAEAALRESEERLRQSQKMEAVGRLAGGIAHDFNNLLTAITGYSRLLLQQTGERSPFRHDLEEIHAASERAASLTRQLLAFSRKQILQPQVLDLNEVITGVNQMLRRLIGEDIELLTRPTPGLHRVRADPGQIEQVLINLAVNAREAMPQGGTLTIETFNSEPKALNGAPPKARYACLRVTDTGCGIDPAIQPRIFEPFFTTREPGKGTGLGLSTVYGIIEQSGGHITVSSAPGQGASFTIYLPVIDETGEKPGIAARVSEMPGGSETVLLVEDEKIVRDLVSQTLRLSGYHVLEAGSGPQALELCQRYAGPIHLLLSDVVMPQMNGLKLAEHLKSSRPDLKLLFMSGYTEDRITLHGLSTASLKLLQKPFTPELLTSRVREVLDALPPASA